jgi:transcriptional regulator with XRE-family HTH domain
MATESSEETIQRILGAYDLGAKLRQLRLKKKIALAELGRHTGLSQSLLSQLENNKLVPTLPTLARIAMVFDVGVDYFFADKRQRKPFAIVRAKERIRFPDKDGNEKPGYFFECLAFSAHEKGLHAYLAEFPPRKPREVEKHFHDGAEFIHVLEGSLEIDYQDRHHRLDSGDSVYFDSSEPHSYRGLSPDPARAVIVTIPPR